MVDKLGIGRVPMVNPRTVFNMDGTKNQGGQVNHYCVLNILQGKKQSAQVSVAVARASYFRKMVDIKSNKIDKNVKIFEHIDLLRSR
jgi:hypothetical protein